MPNTPNRAENFTQDQARQVAWIVYVNGIEIPAVSVNVSYGVWAIPECQLTLIPHPILHRLGAQDRVTVQVFYCDYWQNSGARENPEFRLMFDGEIVGWGYTNVQKQRALSFSCVDYMQIFTQLFFFFMSSLDDIAIGTSNRSIGISAGTIQTAGYGAIYPYSLFSQGLVDPGTSGTDGDVIERPVDFAYNVVRSLIKRDHPNRTVPSVNFFSPWVQRTNFHRRWVALPYLETGKDADGNTVPGIFPILRAVQAEYAVNAVARMASQGGNAGSIWEMLTNIYTVLMMEVQMLPTPCCLTGDIKSITPLGPPGDTTALGTPTLLLSNYFVKPQFLFGLPPVCNVFFPSQVISYTYQENFVTQPTRMYFSEEALNSYLNTDNNTSPGFAQTVRNALTVAHPEEVNQAIRNALNNERDNGKNILVYPEEFFRGPVVDRRPMPRWFFFLQGAQQGSAARGDTNTTNPREVAPGDTSRDLYRKYAAYEYHKERYARRGGSVQLAFNPYPVPGFPCAIFDRRSTQVDVFGYVTQVTQSMSSRGWGTTIAYSYARTFQEMFELLRRNVELENDGLDQDSDAVRSAVDAGEQSSQLGTRAEPVGAIVMAPAEPLVEIRDVIQNYDRAEAFYQSLFYRVPGPEAREISEQQAASSATAFSGPVNQEEAIAALPDTAVFKYGDIIAFATESEAQEEIHLEGIDASTRDEILRAITTVRQPVGPTEDDKTSYDAQLAFLRNALARPDLSENTPTEEWNLLESNTRLNKTYTNIRGDAELVIKPQAQALFSSYDAAMRYGARPICTLDEYIQFLGDQATPEGRVDPDTAFRDSAQRTFPAPYYARIRKYRAGPPEIVPEFSGGNVDSISSPASGVATQPGNDPQTSIESQENEEARESGDTVVDPLPVGFPENRSDWDTLLTSYRNSVLNRLPPRN